MAKSNVEGYSNAAGYGWYCKTCKKAWPYLGKSTCTCDDAPVTHATPAKRGETWKERCERESVYNR